MLEGLLQPWFMAPQGWAKMRESAIRLSTLSGTAFSDQRPARDILGYELPQASVSNGIGIVPIHGPIYSGMHPAWRLFGFVAHEDIEADIQSVIDQGAHGILLHVRSPGGSVLGTPELASTVTRTAADMPVVAWTDDMMASAAYYISAGSTLIASSESSVVGSIGTIAEVVDQSEFLKQIGITVEQFTSGKYKGMGSGLVPLTDEQREWMQSHVDTLGQDFKDHILQNRANVNPSSDTMEGQWFTGKEAMNRGLVDMIAPKLEDAISIFG